jgi:hypothetical protein
MALSGFGVTFINRTGIAVVTATTVKIETTSGSERTGIESAKISIIAIAFRTFTYTIQAFTLDGAGIFTGNPIGNRIVTLSCFRVTFIRCAGITIIKAATVSVGTAAKFE